MGLEAPYAVFWGSLACVWREDRCYDSGLANVNSKSCSPNANCVAVMLVLEAWICVLFWGGSVVYGTAIVFYQLPITNYQMASSK
jgi:hypothetical protein